MKLTEFDYNLPEELIAQTPVEPRNSSRLMVLDPVDEAIEHRHFYDLKEYLEPGDTLIFNDTRVLPARLLGWREGTGGKVEVFLLRRIDGDTWETLVKPGRKAREGQVVRFSDELTCTVQDSTDFGGRIVKFNYEGIFEEILDRLGETPLPPYIHEKLEDGSWQVTTDDAWNWALVRDEPMKAVYAKGEPGAFGVGEAPVKVLVKAAPVDWQMDGGSAGSVPMVPVVRESDARVIELVPFGGTALRIGQFPLGRGRGDRQ